MLKTKASGTLYLTHVLHTRKTRVVTSSMNRNVIFLLPFRLLSWLRPQTKKGKAVAQTVPAVSLRSPSSEQILDLKGKVTMTPVFISTCTLTTATLLMTEITLYILDYQMSKIYNVGA